MNRVLVLCTGNSCRSQMAEGFFRHYGGDTLHVCSAGIEAHGLNPRAVQVMQEIGIDISGQRSEQLDRYLDEAWDYVLTVCDDAAGKCPVFPGQGTKIHRSFPDPAKARGSEEEIMAAFRAVRDEIGDYCLKFTKELA